MMCKSHVSVNDSHLRVQTFYTYTYIVAVYTIFTYMRESNVNICQIHLHISCVNVLGCVNINVCIIYL